MEAAGALCAEPWVEGCDALARCAGARARAPSCDILCRVCSCLTLLIPKPFLRALPLCFPPGVDPVYFVQAYSAVLLIAKPIEA